VSWTVDVETIEEGRRLREGMQVWLQLFGGLDAAGQANLIARLRDEVPETPVVVEEGEG
jgi:hypothetical protein